MRFLIPLFALLLVPTLTRAEPFEAQRVPADAKWVLHVDMDTVRTSEMWKLVEQRINANPEAVAKIEEVAQHTGMMFPEDVYDFTVYSRSFEETDTVVILRASTDKNGVLALLQFSPSYSSTPYGAHTILSWDDKGKVMHGAYYTDDEIVISQKRENVEAALDVIDGKGAALPATMPSATGDASGVLAYVAGQGLDELRKLKKPESPLFSQIDSAWLTLGEAEEDALLRGAITAKSPESAVQMQRTLEGLRSMLALLAAGEEADLKTRIAAEALSTLKISVADAVLNVEWPMSMELVKRLSDLNQPATAPAE